MGYYREMSMKIGCCVGNCRIGRSEYPPELIFERIGNGCSVFSVIYHQRSLPGRGNQACAWKMPWNTPKKQ
ncbi:MAG: hypothetical protein DRH37_08690 [Deltaproteobacteria bacterium]|nr:MAG: hypothetical protein DRH37_08690 [Deltaproteobacteria bacterium]